MRLIDADALKKAFKVEELYWGKRIINEIDNNPTVEFTEEQAIDKLHETGWLIRHDKEMTERPQGEWIRTGSLGNGNAHYECSNCHYGDEHAESQEVPYCWHCGASMKKGGAE